MMYELSQAYAGRQRAAGDSMMADFNRQQTEQLTASMKSLDEIGRSLDSLKTSMESLDNSSSRMTDLSEMPNREEIPSSDLDLDDLLGVKETWAKNRRESNAIPLSGCRHQRRGECQFRSGEKRLSGRSRTRSHIRRCHVSISKTAPATR